MKGRLLYQIDTFYFLATEKNLPVFYYVFFEFFSDLYLSFVTNLISLKWYSLLLLY